MTVKVIRWILSLLLIGGVYFETGVWTALFAFLTLLESELIIAVLKKKRII